MIREWFRMFRAYPLFHILIAFSLVGIILFVIFTGGLVTGSFETGNEEYTISEAGESISVDNTLYQYDDFNSDQQDKYDKLFHGQDTIIVESTDTTLPSENHVVRHDGTFYLIEHDNETDKPTSGYLIILSLIAMFWFIFLPESRIPDKYLKN